MSNTTIPNRVKRELWFAAHGRCEFAGCNKQLFIHGITMDECNISNYAHIIADSPNGPRGDIEQSKELATDVSNLILLCPECHKLIDSNVGKYTAELLRKMKREHEERILHVTGIQPEMKSVVVAYGPKIGKDTPAFHKDVLFNAIFPNRYPANEKPIEIQMKNSVIEDGNPDFWAVESRQIEKICEERIIRLLEENEVPHISLFALGPQPLLVKLGTVLNDKYPVTVFQYHRGNHTWRWHDDHVRNDIQLVEPHDKTNDPVLVIALSADTIKERVARRFCNKASIWTITCNAPDNDMLTACGQLDQFSRVARKTMDAINSAHPEADNLKIFMAAPAACAVALGRIRMPKADMPWIIYDYWRVKNEDIKTITIS